MMIQTEAYKIIMSEKSKLIKSMTNLINHIHSSRAHQLEIFQTFSNNDLSKIIANLQDSNQTIRIITLTLIALLLHNNPHHQLLFCEMIRIPYLPGKLILTSQPNLYCLQRAKLNELLKLIKQDIPEKSKGCLYWYIDVNAEILEIRYVNDFHEQIDPLRYVTGVIMQQLIVPPESKVVKEIESPRKPTIPQKYSYEQNKSIHNQSTQSDRPNYYYKKSEISPRASITSNKEPNLTYSELLTRKKQVTMQTIPLREKSKQYKITPKVNEINSSGLTKYAVKPTKRASTALQHLKQMQFPMKYIKTESKSRESSNRKNQSYEEMKLRLAKLSARNSPSPRQNYL